MNRFTRILLTFVTSVLAVPFISLLVVEGYLAPLQTVLGPNHWCVYGKFELCFLQGDYSLLADTLSYCSLALVSAGYCWLQWRLIWKR